MYNFDEEEDGTIEATMECDGCNRRATILLSVLIPKVKDDNTSFTAEFRCPNCVIKHYR